MQSRTPAPIPPATELSELRALYTRVHWLVVADMDREIARLDRAVDRAVDVMSPHPESEAFVHILSTLRTCVTVLCQRKSKYESDYRHYAQQTDTCSLEAMRRFIGQARDLHSKEPEFGFLFAEGAGAEDGA